MARLIYAFLALSLGTLVAGFLVRDSSIPLLVSIGLSALVLLLILVGSSRRLRRSNAMEDEQAELASLEIVEVDEADAFASADVGAPEGTVAAPKRRPRTRRPKAAEDTQSMAAIADATPERSGGANEQLAIPDQTEVVAAPKRSRRKAAAKPRPPRRRAGTIVEPQDDAFPEFEVEAEAEPSDDEEPSDTSAQSRTEESIADAEPPLTIEVPRPRKQARPRRRTAATDASKQAVADSGAEPTGVIGRLALSQKVWVIPGRSRYHTQDCRFAKGDTLREVTETTAVRRGYVACTVCKPGSA